MNYRVSWSDKALKDLRRMDKQITNRVVVAIDAFYA
jgi:mRNA-degrading endonuclease RelE of RelBE toxin-antitoxin system